MSPINGSEPSQSKSGAEGRCEEKNVLCDQIKEIVAALNDIRSQLAEQNKYLDVLAETYVRKPASTHAIFADELEKGGWDAGSDWGGYVDFAQEESLAETRELGAEAEAEDEDEEEGGEEEEEEEEEEEAGCDGEPQKGFSERDRTLAGFREEDARDIHDAAPTRGPLEGAVLAATAGDVREKSHHLDSTSTVLPTCYLPLGLVISLFCMRFFNAKQSAHASQASFTTIFVVLSLAAYIFATFTLWFLREEDWVKRVIGSWKLANASSSATRTDQDQGSRFPDLLLRRRRRALETS